MLFFSNRGFKRQMIKKVPSTTKKHFKKIINIKRKNLKLLFYEKKKVIVMFIAF